MNLPKLYAPVNIKFWTLRSRGGCFDIDTEVIRKCRRVIGLNNEWCWQIVNSYELSEWDNAIEQDYEVLEAYGQDLEFKVINAKLKDN